MRGDVESSQEELGLDVLVNVVEARHVRRPVTDHQVGRATSELRHDLVGRGELRDVALQLDHPWQWSHGLQVNGDYLDIFPLSLRSLQLSRRSNF